jgi:hypothetical protein
MKSNKNKLLKSLDLFGDEIRFNLKGEPLFKTKIGGIGSLILIGILITFLIFGAINVFAKKTYYVF